MKSGSRVWTIAQNTLTEALRDRVLNLVLVFALVIIGSALFFLQFTFEEQFKFLKDFSLGAITLFGTLMAVLAVAQLLPSELESRTIYTILSKPVRRWEFLTGKFLGIIALLSVAMALMTLVFGAVLLVREQHFIAEAQQDKSLTPEQFESQVTQIHHEARDPRLAQAVLLAWAKVTLIAALALVVSTFATSTIFTVVTTLLLVVIGHLQGTARDLWLQSGADSGWLAKVFLGVLSFLLPDLGAYSVIDDIVAGNAVPWAHTENLLAYSLIYVGILVLVSQLIFNEREL